MAVDNQEVLYALVCDEDETEFIVSCMRLEEETDEELIGDIEYYARTEQGFAHPKFVRWLSPEEVQDSDLEMY